MDGLKDLPFNTIGNEEDFFSALSSFWFSEGSVTIQVLLKTLQNLYLWKFQDKNLK